MSCVCSVTSSLLIHPYQVFIPVRTNLQPPLKLLEKWLMLWVVGFSRLRKASAMALVDYV